MAASHRPGELRHRLALQRRASDDNGDPLGAWVTVCTRAAKLVNLRGGEAVMQQRLQGDQPAILIVRACSETRLIDNSWRAVNDCTRQIYDVSAATQTTDQAWMEVLATAKSGDLFEG